ncbi:ACT domain-containing protein [Conservatibacter flavescens]|uniref:Acetyltransferase n=1 Tax=Conservatibacter flavescens TaxID=28161 RepID=A0A2M8S4G4_9PAST|nr:ACT domain-containing protein [Conservatibacter flavescens]PJG86039.1 acetyltransferase [Conservatibacter flavescens]
MTSPINELNTLIQSMQPVLNDGCFVYTTVNQDHCLPLTEIIASIREKEGLSLIIRQQTAEKYQLPAQFPCAWITLNVHSDLEAVGLTAAFSRALGNAGISCNVVAGHYHDHIFVPFEKKELAMTTLIALQQGKSS